MKRRFLFAALVLFIMSLQACNHLEDPVSTQPPSPTGVSWMATDSVSGQNLSTWAYVGQAIVFVGQVNEPNYTVHHWEFVWGDGSPNSTGNGATIAAAKKYWNQGNYSVTIRTWDANNSQREFTGPFEIRPGTQTLRPVLKLQSASHVGGNTWDYNLLFLRAAVECTPADNPFFVDTIGNWNPESMGLDTTADGYYTFTKRFIDGQIDAFTYGGSFPGCYASIAPREGRWTNIYYLPLPSPQDFKMRVRFSGGQIYTASGGTTASLPGIVGDSANLPVLRFGLSPNEDSVYVYCNKLRASGISDPRWYNNIFGMNNGQLLYDTPGYPDWWNARFALNNLPVNTALTMRYGTTPSLASMSTSYFWDAADQWLEAVFGSNGHRVVIENPNTGKKFTIPLRR